MSLLIIFFSSVLIDGDHYFYYILRTKNFSLTKCYAWYKKHLEETLALPMNERKKIYRILHSSRNRTYDGFFFSRISVSQFFMLIFIGFLLHFIVDIPHEYYIKRTLHKISLIYSYIQFRKLEK